MDLCLCRGADPLACVFCSFVALGLRRGRQLEMGKVPKEFRLLSPEVCIRVKEVHAED